MTQGDWGERGDFRKVTVTLPPDVYDALVQESARRKSARDPNHLLSAIAREWFAHRQPLLPIEKTELCVYRFTDAQPPWFEFPNSYHIATRLGQTNEVVEDLLVDMHQHGWLRMEKYSQEAGRYLPFAPGPSTPQFFHDPCIIRIQVTIPGRRRKEALEAKELMTRQQGADNEKA